MDEATETSPTYYMKRGKLRIDSGLPKTYSYTWNDLLKDGRVTKSPEKRKCRAEGDKGDEDAILCKSDNVTNLGRVKKTVCFEEPCNLPPLKNVGKLGIDNRALMDTLANDGIISSAYKCKAPSVKNLLRTNNTTASSPRLKTSFIAPPKSICMSKDYARLQKSKQRISSIKAFDTNTNDDTRFSRHGVGIVANVNLNIIGDGRWHLGCQQNENSNSGRRKDMLGDNQSGCDFLVDNFKDMTTTRKSATRRDDNA